MRFAYARTGGPLLNWSGVTPPSPSRAGETRSLGAYDVPLPGAPEIVAGYESPAPGAAVVHLGGYMPEGAARAYGQTTLSADQPASMMPSGSTIRRVAALASVYHGMKRNNGSIMWGLLWGLAAFISPANGLIVPVIGVVQGFGQAKPKNNPARPRRIIAPKNRAKKRAEKRAKKNPWKISVDGVAVAGKFKTLNGAQRHAGRLRRAGHSVSIYSSNPRSKRHR